MLIAGAGPFLSWKRAKPRDVLRRCLWTTVVATGLVALLALALRLTELVGLFGVFIAVWLAVATLQDLLRRAGLPKVGARVALRRIAGLPRSAWGLYLGHAGLAIAAAGVVAISVWREEVIQTVQPGNAVEVGPYAFTLIDIKNTTGPNYQTSIAAVRITRDGKLATVLFPERRWYPVERKPTTEAGIETLWHGDLYAVLGDPNGSGGFVMRYYYNPGVPWMWLGSVIICLSALISLTDRRLRIGAPTRWGSATTGQPAE